MQIRELLDELLTSLETGPLISAVRHFEAKPAVFASFPSSLDPRIVEALKGRGVEQLYSHQASAFETAAKGEHLVVVTPTASGKTLCYNLRCYRPWCSSRKRGCSTCSPPRRWPRTSSRS